MRLKKKEIEEKQVRDLVSCHCGKHLTYEEAVELVKKLNPPCGRGGCLHEKLKHIENEKGNLECHKCSCPNFTL
jgi:hypothetical protein